MFFFGLFSSNLPYAIIAIIYFIGIGSYSFEKLHEKFSKEKQPGKELKYSQSALLKASDIYFVNNNHEYKSDKTALCLNENGIFKCKYLQIHYENTLLGEIRSDVSFYKFTRPPPVC